MLLGELVRRNSGSVWLVDLSAVLTVFPIAFAQTSERSRVPQNKSREHEGTRPSNMIDGRGQDECST
jgi:hypothetical protein